MIFSLLLAAIAWNLGTWAMGHPQFSSSHALIGSIMGVGLANQLMAPKPGPRPPASIGDQAYGKCFSALLFSSADGLRAFRPCCCWVMKLVDPRNKKLYEERRQGNSPPPPWWIRGLLILTCTRRVLLPMAATTGKRAWG